VSGAVYRWVPLKKPAEHCYKKKITNNTQHGCTTMKQIICKAVLKGLKIFGCALMFGWCCVKEKQEGKEHGRGEEEKRGCGTGSTLTVCVVMPLPPI